MVEPEHLTSLYTAAAVMDMVGGLVSGPALSATFRWGLSLGEQWLGAPFLYASILFLVITFIMFVVKIPGGGDYVRVRDEDSVEESSETAISGQD